MAISTKERIDRTSAVVGNLQRKQSDRLTEGQQQDLELQRKALARKQSNLAEEGRAAEWINEVGEASRRNNQIVGIEGYKISEYPVD